MINSSKLEIQQAPAQFQLIAPVKTLIEQEWFISSLSIVVGFLLGLLATLFKEWRREYLLKKALKINLFDEIFQNRVHLDELKVTQIKDTINKFKALVYNNPAPTSGPSLAFFDILHIDYYNIYSKDLFYLEEQLRERIVHFYSLIKSIYASSKKIEECFQDFYLQKGIVGPEDICKFLDKLTIQTESAYVVGTEALALFINSYKYSGRLPTLKDSDLNLVKEAVAGYFNKIGRNIIVELKEIRKNVSASDLLICMIVMKENTIQKEGYGKYKFV